MGTAAATTYYVTTSDFCPKNSCHPLEPLQAFFFLAVFFERLKAASVGAPLLPGLRIFSPLPAAIRLRLALMLEYKPFFLVINHHQVRHITNTISNTDTRSL